MIGFISGHIDVTKEFFLKNYKDHIQVMINNGDEFVVGDSNGIDLMTQEYLANNLSLDQHHRVTVYHMFEKPRNLVSELFKLVGGFTSDDKRDEKMTEDSDYDIAYVRTIEESKKMYGNKFRPKRISGTQKNIDRRQKFLT